MRDVVLLAYREGVSTEGKGPAHQSALLKMLSAPGGHYDVQLTRSDLERFIVWLDTYAQQLGSFDSAQEQELERLRDAWAYLLAEKTSR